MKLSEYDFLPEGCERPQHFRVDQWYVHSATMLGVELWRAPSEHEILEINQRKSRRRIEKWWRKPTEPTDSPSNEKLAEAKRSQFTTKGKQERVAKSLAALSQPPYIRLTA